MTDVSERFSRCDIDSSPQLPYAPITSRSRALTRLLPTLVLVALLAPVSLLAGELNLSAPLPADPDIHYGVLPNGMHYEIRAHHTPPGKVAMWLHVGSGSLNEDDNQRGLAHYLEHLAFNGSKNFPAGSMIERFEAIGLSLGRHQNAYTDFDQTTFSLSLPDTKTETIDLGLLGLADIAHRLTLDTKEIDAERDVILEEARSYMGPGERTLYKTLPVMLPGSRFSQRLPIGQSEDIKHANRALLKAYYDKWYRPDNTTLLVVGDIDPSAMEKRIAQHFGDWKAVPNHAPDASSGIQPYAQTRAAVITDPELVNAEVSAMRLKGPQPLRTYADYRQSLIDYVGAWIINRRFEDLISEGNPPFLRAGAGSSPLSSYATLLTASAHGKSEDWKPMLQALLAEIKRGRDHGFQQQEFEDAKKALLTWAEDSARTEPTRDARYFISSMNESVTEGTRPISAAQELEVLKKVLPTVGLADIDRAFRADFAPQQRLLLVKLPEKNGQSVPKSEDLIVAAQQAESVAVAALPARKYAKTLLAREPKDGTIATQTEDRDLHVRTVTFTNGVRVHIRPMDYKKDQVFVAITLADGTPMETAANRGITALAARAFVQPATRLLSSSQIRDLMNAKNVDVSGRAQSDSLSLSISGTPADLEDGFRLAYLLLTQPKIESSAFNTFKQRSLQWLDQVDFSVDAQLSQRVSALLMNEDPRFLPPTRDQLGHLTLVDAQQWLDRIVRTAPIEVAIVGDITSDRALMLARKYLGSLPKRDGIDEAASRVHQFTPKPGPFESLIQVNTITPRARVQLGWRGPNWKDVKDRRALDMAASILEIRMFNEIREKRGLVYSVNCGATAGQVYQGSGQFSVSFTTDPEKAAEAANIAQTMVEHFVKEGPTATEMDTMRRQLKHQLETMRREPTYWASVLSAADYYGTEIADVKNAPEAMLAYSAQDLQAAMRKYLTPDRRLRVVSAPVVRSAQTETRQTDAVQPAATAQKE